MRWARTLHRTQRVAQGLSGLLALNMLWQLVACVQAAPVLAAHTPVIQEGWMNAPAGLTISLEHLVPSRAASEPALGAPLATGPVALHLKLQGIIFGDHPRAYVVDEATGQTVTVRPGDTLGSITITAIHERTVIIDREGDSYELRL